MRCTVYRSDSKEFTYIYLAESQDWDELPADLRTMFGEGTEVMQLDLATTRKLARADIAVVRHHLEQDGYFLQLPPRHSLEDEIGAGMAG